MVSLLTQWYTALGRPPGSQPAAGDDVDYPDNILAVIDLEKMFLQYVLEAGPDTVGLGAIICLARMFAEFARETEKLVPGNFLDFLQRQAIEPFLPEDPDDPA